MFEFQRFLCYICMYLFTFLYNFKISGINKERNVRTWIKEEVEKFTQVLDRVRQQVTPNNVKHRRKLSNNKEKNL